MIALDTNILIYAESLSDQAGRDAVARSLLRQLSAGSGMIPLQVFGEFLNACRSKRVMSGAAAIARVEEGLAVFETPVTLPSDLIAAADLVSSYNLQFFDALIISVAARSGASILLSEDMQDRLEIAGLSVLNPFNPANADRLADLLT